MTKLQELFRMQQQLDAKIETEHNLIKSQLVQEKILALFVELGELANETRCFKFWSLKKAEPREKILEEYVDGLHFILSLGITFSYEIEAFPKDSNSEKSVVEQFNKIYQSISTFDQEKSEDNYKELFSEYIVLGNLLSFTEEEMYHSYKMKNAVNVIRQESGY
jgi:dimeric dUTPase (all-alpha-NTP-PPase superfamily)